MIKKFCVFLFLLVCQLAFSQEKKPDALKIYNQGRDAESAGRVAAANRYYADAVRILNAEIKENYENADSHLVLSWTLFRQGKYQEAANEAEIGLKLKPNDPQFNEALGESLFYLDKYERSEACFQAYLGATPNGIRASTAYFFLGEIYRLTKRYNLADIAYSSALQKSPTVALWWYRLGNSRAASGDVTGAKNAFNQALKLRPDFAEAKAGLAKLS